MKYQIEEICKIYHNNELTLKEQYEIFYEKVKNIINFLSSKNELIEWNIELGTKAAEIHHNSHTWCFCEFDNLIKRINESKEPFFLGDIFGYKAYQNNNLQSNEVIIKGINSKNEIYAGRFFVEFLF